MFLSRSSLWFVGAALLCLTGCDVGISSSLPSVVDDRIVGDWRGPKELGKRFSKTQVHHVRRSGDHYEIGDSEEIASGRAAKFSLAKAGEIMLIQEVGDSPDPSSACGRFPSSNQGCRCLLGTVEIGQDRCVFRMFDAAALFEEARANKLQFHAAFANMRDPNGKEQHAIVFGVQSPSAFADYLAAYIPKHRGILKKPDTFVRLQ
jgi:hypothetical protein